MPGRAASRIVVPDGETGHFEYMYVEKPYRRKGYCFELLKFAIEYTSGYLEMDICHQSKIPQRHAKRLGYRKIGGSQRFVGCSLWRHEGSRNHFPKSRSGIRRKVKYKGKGWRTEVLYLREY